MESQHQNGAPGHEKSDADVRPILQFLVGLGVLLVVVMIGMTFLFNALESRFERAGKEISPLVDTAQIPPGPRLQADPAVDLRQLRQWEQERLNGYGWVDQNTGVLRIPIERAKQLMIENEDLRPRHRSQ